MELRNKFEKKIRRIDTPKGRYYYHIDDPTKFYISATGFIKSVLPSRPYLENWKINTAVALGGKEEMERYVDATASYGTILDSLVDKVFEGETITAHDVRTTIMSEMHSSGMFLQTDFINRWTTKITKDLLAIMKWAKDYKFEPVLVQQMVLVDARIGGTIDFAGWITYEENNYWGDTHTRGANKGKPKKTKKEVRKFVVVDLKSGKSFYESHELQLVIYRRGYEQLFPELPPVEGIYNLAPNEWRGDTPTYKFKEQTHTSMTDKYDHYIALGDIDNLFKVNPTFTEINKVSLEEIDYKTYTLEEYLIRGSNEKVDNERRTNHTGGLE